MRDAGWTERQIAELVEDNEVEALRALGKLALAASPN